MGVDFLRLESELLRQGISIFTIKGVVGSLRRLEEDGALNSKEEFDRFTVQLFKRKVARSYFNKYVQALHHYGTIFNIPWTKEITSLKPDKKVRLTFSDEEVEAFCSIPRPRNQTEGTYLKWQTFWHIIAYVGCRPIECRSILRNDVDMQSKAILFRSTKTHMDRRVPIPPNVEALLKEYLKQSRGKYLFYYKDSNEMMSDGSYLKDFKWRCKHLGITGKQPYSLRHSFIMRLVADAEAPLFVVQDIVGHSSSETTREYYHGDMKLMHKTIKKDPLLKKLSSPVELIKTLQEYIESHNLESDTRFDYALVQQAITTLYQSIKVK